MGNDGKHLVAVMDGKEYQMVSFSPLQIDLGSGGYIGLPDGHAPKADIMYGTGEFLGVHEPPLTFNEDTERPIFMGLYLNNKRFEVGLCGWTVYWPPPLGFDLLGIYS